MAKLSDEDNKKIETAKKKYDVAKANGDEAGMKSAHAEAESVRANYGYSGGGDGSEYKSLSNGEPLGIGNGGKSGSSSRNTGTSTNYGSYQDDIKKLSDLQKKQQIAQLKQAKEKALANLDAQEQEIKPMYQEQRNLASANSQQGARSFAEYLANRGLTNSGAAAQGEINRQSALQNTLGQIGTAEANAFRDIANQRTAIENDYVANLANANASIEADYFANLLAYNQQQRQMIEQLQLQAQNQYANDYQAQINNLLAQGYSPNSLEVLQLQALRGDKINNNYTTAQNNALASIQAGNINYNNASALGWTVPQAQEYYNQIVAQQQAQAEQQAIENQIKLQQLANDTLQTNYNINKPYYKPSDSNINNKYVSYSTHKDIIENNYASKDAYDNTVYDKTGIINYIENEMTSGRMSETDAETLMNRYKIAH